MSEFREENGSVVRLRAIERTPRFVADERVLDVLAPRDRTRGIERNKLRAYRLVLLLLQMIARASRVYRPEAPWEVSVSPDTSVLSTLSGLSLGAIDEALADLRRAGVLVPSEAGDRLAEEFFAPNPSVAELDWPWIVDRLSGVTSGLMVARALADLLPHPGEWTPVLQPDLALQAAYSSRAVRDALQLVEERGIIERNARQKLGVYRFSARARGVKGAEPELELKPRVSASPIARDAEHSSELAIKAASHHAPQASSPGVGGMAKVSVGGINLQVPQGSDIRPIVGDDGRVRLGIALPGLPEMIIEVPSDGK